MAWTDGQLRQAFQDQLGGEADERCPTADAIWGAVTAENTSQDRYQVILHMAECAHCAQSWQLARAMAAEQSLPQQPQNRPSLWRRWLNPMVLTPALAGAAALVAAAVFLFPATGPVPPAPNATGVLRGEVPAPVLLTEYGVRLTTGDVLTWEPSGNATLHRVMLHNPDTGLQHQTLVEDDSAMLITEEIIDRMGENALVQWYVTAIDGDHAGAVSEIREIVLAR